MANFDYGTGRRKTAIARTRLYTGSPHGMPLP